MTLTTWTDCENKWRSLQAADHEVHVVQYDDRPHDRHDELVEVAQLTKPDAIVFIGAVEQYHNKPVPRPDVLCRLREVAPTVHMCNDAADPPWWPMLEEYHKHECFDVQVSIDGNRDCPIAGWPEGMVLLTPLDVRAFEYAKTPWAARPTPLGACGGFGHGERGNFIAELGARGALQFTEARETRSYDEYAWLLGTYRSVFNHPMTGSGQCYHVKGRVLEAGFAGAVAFDRVGSPISDWFEPGVDFLQYETVDDIVKQTPTAEMAARFNERVVREHHPRVFWDKVFSRLC